MELKEFSHKGEAIEKEIKKEFQFMGRTIKKRRVGLIIAAAGVIAVIAVALFIHSQQFDVWDYITISYEGANGYAKPVFTLNKDKLYKELMGKSTDSDKSYNVKMLIASIETSTDEEDIANGDTYKVRLEVDKKYEDAAGVSVGGGNKKIKASGISKGTSVELFDKVDVTFTGVSPQAGIVITNNWVHNIETSYNADKLPEYVDDVSLIDKKVIEQVSKEVLETINKETADNTFHMLYKATKDTAYLYHINEETCSDAKITGIYYLQKKGNAGETNNYIYITASATISDSEDSKTVYFAFSYSNAYINADGTFDMNHDNEEKRYVCSTDYDSLYSECIGSKSDNYTIKEVK